MSFSKTQENLDLGVVDPFPTTPALTLEGGGCDKYLSYLA